MATSAIQADHEPTSAEMDARDRVGLLILYLRSQLDHAKTSFDIATDETTSQAAKTAATHGFCALEIASEYLDEFAKLEQRPTAGRVVA